MRHLFSLALLILFTVTYTYAQQDFRQGYIIQQGDTVQGYLDYRGDVKNSQTISYKKSLSGDSKLFFPDDISGYGYHNGGKTYESIRLPLSDSANAETIRVFANVLVKGKASLYTFRDQSMTVHYYLQKDTALLKLTQVEHQRTDDQNGKNYTFINKKYIGILNYLFNDCNGISDSDLKYISLNSNSLIKITNKYNQCVSSGSISVAKESNRAKLTISPVLLFSYAKLENEQLKQFPFKNSKYAGAGISLNVVVPTFNEKVSLQTELLYVPYKFTGSYTKEGEFPYKYETYYDLAYLKLPIQIRYIYPKGRFQPFINAGFMFGYCLKNDNKYTATSLRNSHYNISTSEENYQKVVYGITTGGGMSTSFKKHTVALEVRYEKNNALSSGLHLNSNIQTFSVLLSCGL